MKKNYFTPATQSVQVEAYSLMQFITGSGFASELPTPIAD